MLLSIDFGSNAVVSVLEFEYRGCGNAVLSLRTVIEEVDTLVRTLLSQTVLVCQFKLRGSLFRICLLHGSKIQIHVLLLRNYRETLLSFRLDKEHVHILTLVVLNRQVLEFLYTLITVFLCLILLLEILQEKVALQWELLAVGSGVQHGDRVVNLFLDAVDTLRLLSE